MKPARHSAHAQTPTPCGAPSTPLRQRAALRCAAPSRGRAPHSGLLQPQTTALRSPPQRHCQDTLSARRMKCAHVLRTRNHNARRHEPTPPLRGAGPARERRQPCAGAISLHYAMAQPCCPWMSISGRHLPRTNAAAMTNTGPPPRAANAAAAPHVCRGRRANTCTPAPRGRSPRGTSAAGQQAHAAASARWYRLFADLQAPTALCLGKAVRCACSSRRTPASQCAAAASA